MSTRTHSRAPASTFLTHYFGRGLVDEKRVYAVQRFSAMFDGNSHHAQARLDVVEVGPGEPGGRPVVLRAGSGIFGHAQVERLHNDPAHGVAAGDIEVHRVTERGTRQRTLLAATEKALPEHPPEQFSFRIVEIS